MIAVELCEKEQDVLLAMHGEAGPLGRLAIWLHLLGCPACRRRRDEYARLSTVLLGLRPQPTMRASAAVTAFWRRPMSVRTAAITAGLVIAAAGLGAFAYDHYVGFSAAGKCEGIPLKASAEPPPVLCE